jgi:hypothetical protein
MIKHDNVKKLLSRTAYQESYMMDFAQPGEVMLEANRLEVHNERRFAVSLNEGLLEGVIDRLILVYQGNKIIAADVIDFKSDAVDGSNLQRHIEFYRPQMDAYRIAVSKFARIPIEKVSTRIVFANVGTVVNLDLIEATVSLVDVKSKPKKPKARGFRGRRPAAKKPTAEKARTDNPKSSSPPRQNLKTKSDQSSKQQKTFWN